MAGLCGLKIVLLWTGIITLTNYAALSTVAPPPQCFLDPSQINQEPLNQLPAEINTKFPPNCVGLTVNYTCQEKEKPDESKELSDLEPFTDYSCTGQVKKNNVPITNTTAVSVRIDCDIEIINTEKRATDTSISLKWTTTSQNCPNVLPTLEKLSYVCSCSPAAYKGKHIEVKGEKDEAGGRCDVTGLELFTHYSCDIQTKYNNKEVVPPTKVTHKTEAGKPEDIKKVTLTLPEHNVIHVSCVHNRKFNGPEKKFIARLYDDSGLLMELKEEKCDFDFGDLSYSTNYRVELTAFNGELKSKPEIKHITTSYNDSLVIRLFFCIIFIIYVVLNVVIYKIYVWRLRKSMKVVNEDVMLESTASYENDPRSERHHTETDL